MTGAIAHPGLLVTLDGPGGAGKTTTAGCLVELLAARPCCLRHASALG